MQVSDLWPILRMWPSGVQPYFPELFPWLCKVRHFTDVLRKIIDDESQAGGAAKELSSHIQWLWDRYLTSILDQYAFNKRNVDIAGLLFFAYRWDLHWFFLISGTSKAKSPIFLQAFRIAIGLRNVEIFSENFLKIEIGRVITTWMVRFMLILYWKMHLLSFSPTKSVGI